MSFLFYRLLAHLINQCVLTAQYNAGPRTGGLLNEYSAYHHHIDSKRKTIPMVEATQALTLLFTVCLSLGKVLDFFQTIKWDIRKEAESSTFDEFRKERAEIEDKGLECWEGERWEK